MNSEYLSVDEKFMLQAIALGEKARITAPPHPWVGCVITKDGHVVAEGFTQPAGSQHAAINALAAAGTQAEGATVYLSLEPCGHYDQTQPCTDALIKAGVKRVVIAIEDPDGHVNGYGIKQLREAGVSVTLGVCAAETSESLKPYLFQRTTKRPYCVAKAGISVDGRIAAADRASQWIRPAEARRDSHYLRAESQAIIIGSGAATIDKPYLTTRDVSPKPSQPLLRVVLDGKGVVLPPSPLLDISIAPTLIFTSKQCPISTLNTWKEAKIEYMILPATPDGEGVDLQLALDHLGKKGILQVIIEGGSTLLGNALNAHMIQKLVLYVGPRILGDLGLPLFKNSKIKSLADAPQLSLINVKQIGECVRLDYEVLPLEVM